MEELLSNHWYWSRICTCDALRGMQEMSPSAAESSICDMENCATSQFNSDLQCYVHILTLTTKTNHKIQTKTGLSCEFTVMELQRKLKKKKKYG